MKLYTFEQNINITGSTNKIYDLLDFRTTQKNINNIGVAIYTVPQEYEARLDLISLELYGTVDFVEELMILNNMMNAYSIKTGDEIYITSIDNMNLLYKEADKNDDKIKKSLINKSKDSKIDPNRGKLTPSVKADGQKQIEVDTKTKTIKIIK